MNPNLLKKEITNKSNDLLTSPILHEKLNRIRGGGSGSVIYIFLSRRYSVKEDKDVMKKHTLRTPINREIFIGRMTSDVIQLFIDTASDLKASYFIIN